MKLLPITTIIISNLSLFHAQNPNDCSCVSVDSRVSDQWCIDDCLCDWCDGCNVGVCAGFCDWNCDAPPTYGPTDKPKTTTSKEPETPAPSGA